MPFSRDTFLPVSAQANSNAPRVWSYQTQDTEAEVLTSGYFNDKVNEIDDGDFNFVVNSESAFLGGFNVSNGNVEMVLLTGFSLSQDQIDAIDSIVDAPDDFILLGENGKAVASPLKKASLSQITGQTEINLSNRGELIGLQQFSISEASQTLLQRDKTTGRRNIFCGVPVDFSVVQGDGKTVTGKPYSIDWGEIQPFAAQPLFNESRQGNYSFLAPITFDRTVTKINFKFQSQVTGVRIVIQENDANGPVVFRSHNDEEWESGEGLNIDVNGDGVIDLFDANQGTPILFETTIPLWITVEKFGDDSDLTILGTTTLFPPLFTPYTTQEYFVESRSELVNAKIYTPVYKNANSTDLTINDLETIAADADFAGGFTLTVDVSEVNTFKVFDYAGRWNAGSRRITVALSNGDNYFLTRRNRNYFFYKDESNNWQWYYTPNFLG